MSTSIIATIIRGCFFFTLAVGMMNALSTQQQVTINDVNPAVMMAMR